VDAASLGAKPIRRLRLVAGKRVVETDLPNAAAGLSRRRLDAALLRLAQQAGAEIVRGRAARAVEGEIVRFDDGEEIAAEALFLATGKHELRGVARQLGRRKLAVGLRTALSPASRLEVLAATIELHLFDHGYAGLLLQEDGSANFCLSVARDRLSDAGSPQALVEELMSDNPRLADRLGDEVPPAWEAIAGVPYGWRARSTRAGLFRIGDQAAVIASLAGDGIAIALNSGAAAAASHLAGGDSAAAGFQSDFAARAARPIRIGEALRAMAEHRLRRRLMMGLAEMSGLTRLAARLTRID
jgi:flavin-dependent dehydrogenase